jgi:hypothetical protein
MLCEAWPAVAKRGDSPSPRAPGRGAPETGEEHPLRGLSLFVAENFGVSTGQAAASLVRIPVTTPPPAPWWA